VSQLIQLDPPSIPLPFPSSGPVTDTYGRVHSDLRISVTDRCNIRCFYCMPETGAVFEPVSKLLTFPEIVRFVGVAASLGFRKLRLTGGEPLLRPKLPELVASLGELPGIEDLALTTNAVLLAKHAQPLFEAGLRRLNIHLDTLDRERFRKLTRRDDLAKVLHGVDTAVVAGFRSIKLNAVAIKGISEPDLIPLVRFARERGMEIRFVEFMPLDAQQIWSLDQVLTADEMIRQISEEFGPLAPAPVPNPQAPATEYRFANGDRIGFIASVSRPFCMNCNRLRLTSEGKLRYCLFAREETDIKPLLNATDDLLETAIRTTIWQKWAGHEISRSSFLPPQRPMYAIGG
jgi:cyclic pyranopterin phosphate synthase